MFYLFDVKPSADVETVRSLVEEMETDSRDEESDDDTVQQAIGKHAIGELSCGKEHTYTLKRGKGVYNSHYIPFSPLLYLFKLYKLVYTLSPCMLVAEFWFNDGEK